jgi:hypothetical protein
MKSDCVSAAKNFVSWTNQKNPTSGVPGTEAPFPDINAELPGVPLEEDKADYEVVTDNSEPESKDLAAACPKPFAG